jgi:hypothetical protein
MGATLTQQRRVEDEGLRIVNSFSGGRARTVPQESVTANYVPAAAVIRRWQALSGITGRKAHAGGWVSLT